MLGWFAVLNIFLSPLLLLVSPLVLSFATLRDVSVVSVVTGLGALLGGLTMALWGGPARRRFRGVLLATVAIAAGSVLTGLAPSLVLIGAGGVRDHVLPDPHERHLLADRADQGALPLPRQGLRAEHPRRVVDAADRDGTGRAARRRAVRPADGPRAARSPPRWAR
ncbi:hypothetical protein [Nonomuraea dietziae]|uniref:hypothetical protein n=1 Tax=Nonomuraea dietziae TaxID=65515 RepID=UPI0031D524BD